MRGREELVSLSDVCPDGNVDCSNIREGVVQERVSCSADQSGTRGPLYQAFFLSRRRPLCRLLRGLIDLREVCKVNVSEKEPGYTRASRKSRLFSCRLLTQHFRH